MSSNKRRLGKGLSALIPEEAFQSDNTMSDNLETIQNIDISLIEPNREQPRKEFDQDKLLELSKSVKAHGIIQPIIVTKNNGGYELVAGERRWRAAKGAGLKEIPCIVRKLERLESTEVALIENIQRENLNAIEEALAYRSLIEKYRLTQEGVADVVGKSRSYITNVTRLLNLDDRVISLISDGVLSSGHGRTLLGVKKSEAQINLAQIIIEKNLNVRETEKLVKEQGKNKTKNKKDKRDKDPLTIGIEESLRKALGTKVIISKGKKKSKIEIEYYSDEDLERILDVLSIN